MKSDSSSTETLSDNEIIVKILAGETHLYETIIRKFNLRLYRIGMSIIDDQMEVGDVIQTTYLNAYLQLSHFQGRSSFSTWLIRILINESLLHKKKRMKKDRVLAEQVRKDRNNQTPLSNLMNKELKEILEKAVSNLPDKYKLVFVMREVQEMSTQETMEILDIGESNVKIRLTRAKEMLRAELSSYYEPSQLFDFNLIYCDKVVDFVMKKITE